MTFTEAYAKAEEWLKQNGYSQFADETWSYRGEEADVGSALAYYIQQKETSYNAADTLSRLQFPDTSGGQHLESDKEVS